MRVFNHQFIGSFPEDVFLPYSPCECFHSQLFRTLQKAVARLVHCASVDTFLCQPVSGWTPLPAHCPFPLHSVGYSTQSTADTTRGVRETPCVRKPSRTQWSSCFFFWLLSTHKRSALRIQKKVVCGRPAKGTLYLIFQMKRVGSFFSWYNMLCGLADAPARKGDCLFDISNENALVPKVWSAVVPPRCWLSLWMMMNQIKTYLYHCCCWLYDWGCPDQKVNKGKRDTKRWNEDCMVYSETDTYFWNRCVAGTWQWQQWLRWLLRSSLRQSWYSL